MLNLGALVSRHLHHRRWHGVVWPKAAARGDKEGRRQGKINSSSDISLVLKPSSSHITKLCDRISARDIRKLLVQVTGRDEQETDREVESEKEIDRELDPDRDLSN